MTVSHSSIARSILLLFFLAPSSFAIDVNDTRLLSEPALSESHVAFVYAGDLWIAERTVDAQPMRARRLTSHVGQELSPRFSPDGKTIAFSAEYDGNVDVYVIPASGGVPRRLTWHPDDDTVLDFSPDGASVLFRSQRVSHTRRFHQLFTVPTAGGFPSRLPIPNAFRAAYSADGTKIAYVPLREVFSQWKNYRGGTASRIWIYDVADHSVVEVPRPEGRSNDTDPMWIGGKVYFRSDRDGEFNLYSFDPANSIVVRHTEHADFPIIRASASATRIVYEQAGYLHLFDPQAAASSRLTIGVAADLIETRPRYANGRDWMRGAHLSPSGSRAVLDFRGEIVTVPAKKGDPRYLTRTPGVHEREPIWSPDGQRIAYFSDAADEYELHVADQSGKGAVEIYTLGGAGFYEDPKWSPDGKKLSYLDNSKSIYWLDLETRETTQVASDVLYGPFYRPHHTWSPDSRWLAYTRNTESNFRQVYLYDLESGRSHPVSEGLSDAIEPAFDASGKYLYFLASTDAGPTRTWFAQSSADMEISHNVYLAVLQRGLPSPLAPESDEEEAKEESGNGEQTDQDEATNDDSAGTKPGKGRKSRADRAGSSSEDGNGNEDAKAATEIDFEGLSQRILALPISTASMRGLRAGKEGQIYFLRTDSPVGSFGAPPARLQHYDLDGRKEETLLEGVVDYLVSSDGEKILATTRQALLLGSSSGQLDAGQGAIDIAAVSVRVDPRAEWRQIFDEAWRINRDFFYDPGMHGADWPAMRDKYSQFLPHLTTRDDLNRVIRWMCSELAIGHHRNGDGDRAAEPETVPGGLLGADFDIDHGRYRFAKVYGGLNWNPDLRSPLTEPGVDVASGEYLIAVEGIDLRPPENLFSRFENTAGRIVEITVGPNPDGSNTRTVKAVPIGNERSLRNRDWVESNLQRVNEATDGKVAYVHVPDTARLGHTYFKRYFFPQAHKQAIIIDERYNGGGLFADYYIDILRRPHISNWAMRYGIDLKTPLASIQGPKVMLIDENAGSGGDMLPWMFRQLGLGKLVGKRTWGGLVGILGFPQLMDGGFVTAPNFAIWTEDGFIVENVGVPPDVEVEQWPAEVIAGSDPQLEKAIELVLEMLEANPPVQPQRPPYPVRVRP